MGARRVVWAVGGSDSSGGAGIQADMRTIHNLGAHAGSIVTAVTAQSARGVSGVWPVPLETLAAQWAVLERDLPPAVVKIGMLATAAHVRFVAERLRDLGVPAVLDPVMGASAGGAALLEDAGRAALLRELIPHVSVLTPNLVEASALLGGRSLSTSEEIETAARDLAALGPSTVIIKGGHREGPLAQDCVLSDERLVWLTSPRLESEHTHGTGCTFASAYAVALSTGMSAIDAAVVAKRYVTEAIRNGYQAGQGAGPVQQGRWPQQEIDLPWLTRSAAAGSQRLAFEPLDRAPGLYAIVDSAKWIELLVGSAVETLQLRIKALSGPALHDEIATSIRLAREAGVPLFINDHWQLAIELGAWGVHLGQEDLDSADLAAIANAGLRLGVSTHCYEEVARAHALRPSYIALGPVFETKIKVMRFAPQGVDALRGWRSTLASYPLVAIGGIDSTNAAEVLATGADSIAVVRAITQAGDPLRAAEELAVLMRARDTFVSKSSS